MGLARLGVLVLDTEISRFSQDAQQDVAGHMGFWRELMLERDLALKTHIAGSKANHVFGERLSGTYVKNLMC